jgi:hypothetical protein
MKILKLSLKLKNPIRKMKGAKMDFAKNMRGKSMSSEIIGTPAILVKR